MPTLNTLLAKLFNQDYGENIRMSELPSPEYLLMPFNFMESTGVLSHDLVIEFLRARKVMQEVFAAGFLEPAHFGIDSKIEPYFTIETNTLGLLREHFRSSTWTYRGYYLQCGFADAQKANHAALYRAISTAQTFHDMMYVSTGSLDPADHAPIQRSVRHVQEYRLAVNGFYSADIAIWRKQLVTYHSAVLIMLKAAWMGRDPQREYDRFLAAGGVYFLQYPKLCP